MHATQLPPPTQQQQVFNMLLHGNFSAVNPTASGRPSQSLTGPSIRLVDGKRSSTVSRCSAGPATTETTADPAVAEGGSNGNGKPKDAAVAPRVEAPLPLGNLRFEAPSDSEKIWTNIKLAFALPWRRFKSESVLAIKLEGEISEQSRGPFDSGSSMPQLCSALKKAAVDPRIKGIVVEIGPLAVGWAKIQELRRHINYFRESGKFTVVYMTRASEKEYYLASAFEEIYMPESSSLSLRGFAVTGTFLRGVLDKIGVEPQVKRIGKYKSAGDQLLRKDMSEAQAEQLQAILDDIHKDFVTTVAQARGKSEEEVVAMMEEGIFDMKKFKEGGWLTDLRYEDEIIDDMRKRTGGKEDEVRKVGLAKYSKVSPTAFGMGGKKKIVVLRTAGAIVGSSSSSSGVITSNALIRQLRALAKDKSTAAVVLRVESPGGDALASDLMWREIKKLGEKKPVVASMGDVAASGGYYLSMGCSKILAEALTLTGSVGVVTGKFNLSELYEKIGYSKTVLSKGRYAEVLNDSRPFNQDEQELFDRAAEFAYESFRNKAAECRGLSVDAMQEVAQGRVWTGARALEIGLVDAVGGVHRAIAIAKQLAEIPEDEKVTVREMGRMKPNPLALLSGGGASAASAPFLWMPVLMAMAGGKSLEQAVASVIGMGALGGAMGVGAMGASFSADIPSVNPFQQQKGSGVQCLMTDVDAATVGGLWTPSSNSASSSSSSFLEDGEDTSPAAMLEALIERLL